MKLFTTIYDNDALLGHLLSHYSRAGVTDFYIATVAKFGDDVGHYTKQYNINLFSDLGVDDEYPFGVNAVIRMRERHQATDEWAIVVDLDEFIEFPEPLHLLISAAEREGANLIQGIMYDRFSLDGQLRDFEADSDLAALYPVRARFCKEVMKGADHKGIIVKGNLQPAGSFHDWHGQLVHSRILEISHYKWTSRMLQRVQSDIRITQSDPRWADCAIEYRRVLDHYKTHRRFAWETFGGQLVPPAQHRETSNPAGEPLPPGKPGEGAAARPLHASSPVVEDPPSEAELGTRLQDVIALSQTIRGWTRGADAEAVARASYRLDADPVIVEIGVFLGCCTVLLAGARRRRGGGVVHCVDPFDAAGDAFSVPYYRDILNSLGGGPLRRHFEANIARAGLADFVRVHQGRAVEVAAEWREPIDLLLLDGDQSPAGARAAYEAWAPFLKPGGTIVLRNTAPRTYAEGHDGHRRLAVEAIVPPAYFDIRQIADTTIARTRRHRRAAGAPARGTAPRIHLYAQCWNDEFMLPYFFRHYDAFVDRYVIYDDGSTDRSLEILADHPKVEIRRFVRADPHSFVRSEQALSNECWKESRGSADWVIVTDVDEHLFHPVMRDYLAACADAGVTLVPALGFQMIADASPGADDVLCRSVTCGAPFDEMMKVSLFRPDDIEDVNFGLGRHQAEPRGELCVPYRDEVLLLHYKYLGIERTRARQQALRARLGERDRARQWGRQYAWSEDELAEHWRALARQVGDVYAMSSETYPLPRWWLPAMPTVKVAAADAATAAPPAPRFLYVADAIRRSHFEIEAEPHLFEFRGNDLFLHPPKTGTTRLAASDIAHLAAGAVFRCGLALDQQSQHPVRFRLTLADGARSVADEPVLQRGERREVRLPLDGLEGPVSIELATEIADGAGANDYAWAMVLDPRIDYPSSEDLPSRAAAAAETAPAEAP